MTYLDERQLQELLNRHAAALRLYARQWCRAPEDAVQEAFVELVRLAAPPNNVAAWLFTTVRRRAMNLARGERRRSNHQRQAGEQLARWFAPSDNHTDDALDIASSLAKLPGLEREIVVARIWGGLSYAEIAAVVELSTSSVHRHYQQALAALGRLIDRPLHDPRQSDESPATIS